MHGPFQAAWPSCYESGLYFHNNCSEKDDIMSVKKVELLAPAGDFACFRAAVNAGADAVYLGGGQYGARAYATNFTAEELQKALRIAHLLAERFI